MRNSLASKTSLRKQKALLLMQGWDIPPPPPGVVIPFIAITAVLKGPPNAPELLFGLTWGKRENVHFRSSSTAPETPSIQCSSLCKVFFLCTARSCLCCGFVLLSDAVESFVPKERADKLQTLLRCVSNPTLCYFCNRNNGYQKTFYHYIYLHFTMLILYAGGNNV